MSKLNNDNFKNLSFPIFSKFTDDNGKDKYQCFIKYNDDGNRTVLSLESDFIALGENFVILDKKSGSLSLSVDNGHYNNEDDLYVDNLATFKSILLTEKDIEETVYNSINIFNQNYIQNKELLSFNRIKALQRELAGNKTNRSASVSLSPVKREKTVQIAEMER